MLCRNIRLRREYLYIKSLEGKERLLYENKRKIKEALQALLFIIIMEGKPIPTELRNEEAVLRTEIDLEDENTLGERTANILKYLFPMPKLDSKRIITFANQSDYILFRHHIYEKSGGPKSIELKEIDPRFELRLYQVKLGMVDQSEAQVEWDIRPYMNTSEKRKFLGD